MPQPLPPACELLGSHNSVTISVSPAPNMMRREGKEREKGNRIGRGAGRDEEGRKKKGRDGKQGEEKENTPLKVNMVKEVWILPLSSHRSALLRVLHSSQGCH